MNQANEQVDNAIENRYILGLLIFYMLILI